MNFESFFFGVLNGIAIGWIVYWACWGLRRPRPSRHVIYRKGQLPEIVE